jgi:hypothetical protein
VDEDEPGSQFLILCGRDSALQCRFHGVLLKPGPLTHPGEVLSESNGRRLMAEQTPSLLTRRGDKGIGDGQQTVRIAELSGTDQQRRPSMVKAHGENKYKRSTKVR